MKFFFSMLILAGMCFPALSQGLTVVPLARDQGSTGAGAQPQATELLARLQQLYPSTSFTRVQGTAMAGVYEIQMGKNIAYSDASGQFFIFGHMFDMASRTDLTAEAINESNQMVDWQSLPLKNAISFGTGARKLAVFSDPDCPFCKQLEKSLLTLKDATVYVFPLPIVQLHPGAEKVAREVWCSPDRAKAWRSYLLDKNKPRASSTCKTPIQENLRLAEKLGISSTPTLIAADGRMVNGAASADEISNWLNQASPDAKEK